MSRGIDRIRAEALDLSFEEREELARDLIQSLADSPELLYEQEWIEEGRRRLDDLKSGRDPGLTMDEFFAAE
ncbi:MAG: addiction module protein [Acidobacteria bacterium]|nr:addiction module protein [Acidobacteriota bacterium]